MKVLHVNDVARVGAQLVREANRRGVDWRLYRIARVEPEWSGLYLKFRRALRGAKWEAGFFREAFPVDLINIHGGNVPRHTRWIHKPFVLHLHGSDVRTVRLIPEQGKIIDRSIAEALQVYYATPNLRECATPLRADAQLQPIIVNVDEVPFTLDAPEEPLVLFPSRWGPEKGGELQIQMALAIRKALGPKVRMQGLNWGENAAYIAKHADVELMPRMDHASFMKWLGTGTVAIGQATGVMGVCELESVATGMPLVIGLEPRWYDGSHPTLEGMPVVVGKLERSKWLDAVVEATVELVKNPVREDHREWVRTMHGPEVAVDRLLGRYAELSL